MSSFKFFVLSAIWASLIEYLFGVWLHAGENNYLWLPLLIIFPLIPVACIKWIKIESLDFKAGIRGYLLGAWAGLIYFVVTQFAVILEKSAETLDGFANVVEDTASKIIFGCILFGFPALMLFMKYHKKKKLPKQ